MTFDLEVTNLTPEDVTSFGDLPVTLDVRRSGDAVFDEFTDTPVPEADVSIPQGKICLMFLVICDMLLIYNDLGVGIAQSLASLSTKRAIQVRTCLNLLVIEGWNSITVLLTRSHQCR